MEKANRWHKVGFLYAVAGVLVQRELENSDV